MMVEWLPECNAGLTVSTPCVTASWRSSPCGPRPPPGAPSPSVSEQVAEAEGVRHLQESRIVLRVGQHPLFPPAPRGLGMDVETAVYLSPRQVGLFLEPHQPLRKVGWEARGSSAVINALSRHRSFRKTAASSLLRGCPGPSDIPRQDGMRNASSRGQPVPESCGRPPLCLSEGWGGLPQLHPCVRAFLLPFLRAGSARVRVHPRGPSSPPDATCHQELSVSDGGSGPSSHGPSPSSLTAATPNLTGPT